MCSAPGDGGQASSQRMHEPLPAMMPFAKPSAVPHLLLSRLGCRPLVAIRLRDRNVEVEQLREHLLNLLVTPRRCHIHAVGIDVLKRDFGIPSSEQTLNACSQLRIQSRRVNSNGLNDVPARGNLSRDICVMVRQMEHLPTTGLDAGVSSIVAGGQGCLCQDCRNLPVGTRAAAVQGRRLHPRVDGVQDVSDARVARVLSDHAFAEAFDVHDDGRTRALPQQRADGPALAARAATREADVRGDVEVLPEVPRDLPRAHRVAVHGLAAKPGAHEEHAPGAEVASGAAQVLGVVGPRPCEVDACRSAEIAGKVLAAAPVGAGSSTRRLHHWLILRTPLVRQQAPNWPSTKDEIIKQMPWVQIAPCLQNGAHKIKAFLRGVIKFHLNPMGNLRLCQQHESRSCAWPTGWRVLVMLHERDCSLHRQCL
mmetsp:Transcript_119770/g.383486  ORF Transcript_119770/g.383486 Transcript_119770/m.383486 type:complete len:424 (-) Transcript_119770:391-1662(-)